MKNLILVLFSILMTAGIMAQVPQGITHQAVMRDSQNQPIVESPIGVRISILQGSVDGEAVYVETHSPISNANGLITYVIGQGAVESGLFSEIDWSAGPYFLKTEADPMGGADFIISGLTQFLSVPYALHSMSAETLKDGLHPGEMNYWDGESWLPIIPGEHNQTLRLCDGVPTWGPCLHNLVLFAEPLEGGSVVGEGEYEEGSEVIITAIPNHGWDFVNWAGDADHLDDISSATAIVTMPAYNISLTASFEGQTIEWQPCPGTPTITDADGNTYNTVLIGEQCWMRENLKTTNYKNNTPIENITEHNEWENNNTGAYAWFGDDIQNKDSYGALYNWHAVNNENGLCPEGWSVPEDSDWTQLVNYTVDAFEEVTTGTAGNTLKSCWQVNSPLDNDCNTEIHPRWNEHDNHYGTDLTGFSALPGGARQPAFFGGLGAHGHWWSNTADNDTNAWMRRISFNEGHVDRWETAKTIGYSVRCIKE